MNPLFSRPEWFDRANCRGVDPALFFPERGGDARPALMVCAGCTVVDECLEYAAGNGEKDGVWGARSASDRKDISKLPTRLMTCGVCEQRFVLWRGGRRQRYCSDRCRETARHRSVVRDREKRRTA